MKKALISFFTLLLFAAAAATAQAKPKLAVFVVGIDDWKRGDVLAHIVGEELNRGKDYQVITRSGAVQVKLKALRRTSWYADGCDIRAWGQQHGVDHICLITTPNDRNFSARLYDISKEEIRRSGGVLGEGMGAVQLKELAWVLAGKLRSSALVADVPCMVYVKGGTFTMGFLPGRDGTDISEALNACPAKTDVEVGDFWIGRHEITVKEWKAVKGNFSGMPNSNFYGDNKPRVVISWGSAQSYVAKLNESMVNTGMVFKLPTEAQWEYAARGGVKMYDKCENGCMYSGSNDIDEVGWYEATWELAGYDYPPDVETKQPNELGIYDMTGSVWEWCVEGWHASCDQPPSTSKYMIRGGCWKNPLKDAYVASRNTTLHGDSGTNVGFRVV